nr:polysaccharide lyase family 7 protein [uncultured Pseudomonas sp.]
MIDLSTWNITVPEQVSARTVETRLVKAGVKLVYTQLRGVGYVQVMVRHRPYDVKSPMVMTYKSMPLNYPFTYTLQVTKAGQLKVNVAGLRYEEKIHPAWAKKRFYFKAGVYTLDKHGPSTEGGKATFSALSVSHKP